MPGFMRLVQQEQVLRRPVAVVTIEPSAFAETWPDRPVAPVKIGIRTISETMLQNARSTASRSAWALHSEDGEEALREAAYIDGVRAIAVAHAATLPEDVDSPYFGEMAEDNAPLALTSEGMQVLFEALERAVIGESPIAPLASDDDIARLLTAAPAALAKMPGVRARRLRRLLAFALSEL